jgi:hypothetical protein
VKETKSSCGGTDELRPGTRLNTQVATVAE